MSSRPAICARMSVLADLTRGRLLLVLEKGETSVSELCEILQLPQSTVSRHLKVLADDGWLTSRPDGTSRFYKLDGASLDATAGSLWKLTRGQVASTTAAGDDLDRLQRVRDARRSRSREFFSAAAGEWDRLRGEVFGADSGSCALLGLLGSDWTVGDLGCGTGSASAALAPFVGRVVAIDESPAMLEAARERLDPLGNVEVRAGELESLPIGDGELDAAVLMLVLHHVAQPELVLKESARVLAPGGRLLIVDMLPHERAEYRDAMGHVWMGFAPEQIERWLGRSGFASIRVHALPVSAKAGSPTLFIAAAREAVHEARPMSGPARPRQMVSL